MPSCRLSTTINPSAAAGVNPRAALPVTKPFSFPDPIPLESPAGVRSFATVARQSALQQNPAKTREQIK
jgi:hypothetical protein